MTRQHLLKPYVQSARVAGPISLLPRFLTVSDVHWTMVDCFSPIILQSATGMLSSFRIDIIAATPTTCITRSRECKYSLWTCTSIPAYYSYRILLSYRDDSQLWGLPKCLSTRQNNATLHNFGRSAINVAKYKKSVTTIVYILLTFSVCFVPYLKETAIYFGYAATGLPKHILPLEWRR